MCFVINHICSNWISHHKYSNSSAKDKINIRRRSKLRIQVCDCAISVYSKLDTKLNFCCNISIFSNGVGQIRLLTTNALQTTRH